MVGVEELLEILRKAVIDGDCERACSVTRELVEKGVEPDVIVREALEPAMRVVGELFESEEYFIPEVLLSAEAFKKSFEVVRERLLKKSFRRLGRIAIGTVRGDIHELGKNLVATMLTVAGFEVIDLGVDVAPEDFVKAVRDYGVDAIGLSALMTSTMVEQRVVIEELERRGLRDCVKVVVGGAVVNEEWARSIGADGYARDAFEAVHVFKKLLGVE